MSENTQPPPSPAIQPKKGLARIEDLHANLELAAQNNDFLKLVNAMPKKEWVKDHPIAKQEIINPEGQKVKVPTQYIPVGIVEYLLTAVFQKWRLEVKNVQVIANSICVTVRLWYMDPITGQWDWQDGIGAAPISTEKGAAATDFTKVITSAVQTGAPAAESYALKDAAEKIGKLFGKDLNRKEQMDYQLTLAKMFQKDDPLPDELKQIIAESTDVENLSNLYAANPEFHPIKEFMELIIARKAEINGTKQ